MVKGETSYCFTGVDAKARHIQAWWPTHPPETLCGTWAGYGEDQMGYLEARLPVCKRCQKIFVGRGA